MNQDFSTQYNVDPNITQANFNSTNYLRESSNVTAFYPDHCEQHLTDATKTDKISSSIKPVLSSRNGEHSSTSPLSLPGVHVLCTPSHCCMSPHSSCSHGSKELMPEEEEATSQKAPDHGAVPVVTLLDDTNLLTDTQLIVTAGPGVEGTLTQSKENGTTPVKGALVEQLYVNIIDLDKMPNHFLAQKPTPPTVKETLPLHQIKPPYSQEYCTHIKNAEEFKDKVSTGSHIAHYIDKWFDTWHHMLVARVFQVDPTSLSSLSDQISINNSEPVLIVVYYDCLPLSWTSNIAQVKERTMVVNTDFFTTPVYHINLPEYTMPLLEQSLIIAISKLETTVPCDRVYAFWKSYSSSNFVWECKTGHNRKNFNKFTDLVTSPIVSLRKNARIDLERNIGCRKKSFEEEVKTNVKKVVGISATQGATRVVGASVLGVGGSSSVYSMIGVAAASSAIVMIPVHAVDSGLHIMNLDTNLDAMAEDGIIQEKEKSFLRKKFIAISVTGNTVQATGIISGAIAGAVVGTALPLPVLGTLLGAVVGGTVGTVGKIVSSKVVESVADKLRDDDDNNGKKLVQQVDSTCKDDASLVENLETQQENPNSKQT